MKSKTKICPICGSKFTPAHNNQTYCSIFCQAQGRSRKRSAWYAAHPGYMTEYMRTRRMIERKKVNAD